MSFNPVFLSFSFFAMTLMTGCTTTHVNPAPKDTSLARALFETEQQFVSAQANGDGLGMANAASARLDLLERLEPTVSNTAPTAVNTPAQRRYESIKSSARVMLEDARAAAIGDPDVLAQIDRRFSGHTRAQLDPWRGIVGTPRKVTLTVGLEIDIELLPGETETVTIPVDGSLGTTVHTQSAGRYAGPDIEVSMSVKAAPHSASQRQLGCPMKSPQTRIPCYVPVGSYSSVEIALENHGTARVQLIVFVSGNAASVETALSE